MESHHSTLIREKLTRLAESVEQVRDLGILPAALAGRFIVRYVRMRNLIVHQYDRLDTRTLFHASRRLIQDAKAYITAVQRYLAR